MASAEEVVLSSTIRCHAWNKDRSLIALSPNTNEIWIYATNGSEDISKWEKLHVLDEHDHLVTAIDWAPNSNRILSCSQDRNAYVWTFDASVQPSGEWKPTLVLLRINRAATCCKWSPAENKFAVGSGAKMVSICYFEQENNWWVSKMIKKPHKSTVLNVAWHPTDNTIVATACSDFKARIFTAYIKEVDGKEKKSTFGDLVAEFTAKGWVRDLDFSPNGKSLAFASHDSTFTCIDIESKQEQTIRVPDLPYLTLRFVSDNAVIAAGYSFTPVAFARKGDKWTYIGHCDTKDKAKKEDKGAVRSAFDKFKTQDTVGAKNAEKQEEIKTRHHNTITGLQVFASSGGKVSKFSTSGLDGRILMWDIASIASKLDGFTL